jgi:hypothetical protein
VRTAAVLCRAVICRVKCCAPCRYIDKTYYLQVHRTSAAMAAFKQRLAAAGWQVQISGRSYNELNIGFM